LASRTASGSALAHRAARRSTRNVSGAVPPGGTMLVEVADTHEHELLYAEA
jgi:hypothetical protein